MPGSLLFRKFYPDYVSQRIPRRIALVSERVRVAAFEGEAKTQTQTYSILIEIVNKPTYGIGLIY